MATPPNDSDLVRASCQLALHVLCQPQPPTHRHIMQHVKHVRARWHRFHSTLHLLQRQATPWMPHDDLAADLVKRVDRCARTRPEWMPQRTQWTPSLQRLAPSLPLSSESVTPPRARWLVLMQFLHVQRRRQRHPVTTTKSGLLLRWVKVVPIQPDHGANEPAVSCLPSLLSRPPRRARHKRKHSRS